MPGFAREWPACTRWTTEYLAEVCGHTPIPVSRYEDEETLVCKEKLTVRDYLAAITATPNSWRNHYMESVVLSELSDELYRDVPIPTEFADFPTSRTQSSSAATRVRAVTFTRTRRRSSFN